MCFFSPPPPLLHLYLLSPVALQRLVFFSFRRCFIFIESFNSIQVFLPSHSSFIHTSPPFWALSRPTFASYLTLCVCVCSLSLRSAIPSPPDHAFHYRAASIDLLAGWSAIDYSTCFSAAELRCAKLAHAKTHTDPSNTPFLFSLLFFFAPISGRVRSFGISLNAFFTSSSSPSASWYSWRYRLVLHYPKTLLCVCKYLDDCFGADC